MQREYELLGRRLQLHLGDITRLEVDAIVSSENSDLIMDRPDGPSVSAAIRRAEGPEIAATLARLGPIEPGRAVVTPARALPCRWVVHAATVVKTEAGHFATLDMVRAAVRSALGLASGLGLSSIAFPAFGVRAAALSVRQTSEAMVEEIVAGLQAPTTLRRVVIALTDPESFLSFFEEALKSATRASAPLALRLERGPELLRVSFPDDQPVAHVSGAPLTAARERALRGRLARLRDGAGRGHLDLQGELAALGAELWALLPPPARDRLEAERGRALALRLDASLAALPFELACDGERLLVERAPIARQLVLDAAPARAAPASPASPQLEALVLAGDPGDLPAARQEAARLVDLLWRRAQRRARPTLLGGARATRAAVTDALRGSDLVHWCGHTRAGEASEPRWQLADEPLRAADLATLRLRARLVVANSCGQDPEGVLARAFLLAGARNLVCTLWDVDDAAAQAFAGPFYEALLQGRTLGAALAEARAAARAADPFHGTAWVHYGDPRDRLFEPG